MERRQMRPPMMLEDNRTPMAWRHRDMSFNGPPMHHHHHHHHRPSSPSETTTSTDDREEVPMMRHVARRPPSRSGGRSRTSEHQSTGWIQQPLIDSYPMAAPAGPYRNGTLRSTRSVPTLALATWDGEPCPVHGHGPSFFPSGGGGTATMRRFGSMFDVRPAFYPPGPPMMMHHPGPAMLDKKSMHGSMQMLPTGAMMPPPPPSTAGYPHIPHHLLPPMLRPRPFVFPAAVEPLPIRDPFKTKTPPPSSYNHKMEEDFYSVDQVCCKGHLIVLWIILAVVTIGVILGIILGVTIT